MPDDPLAPPDTWRPLITGAELRQLREQLGLSRPALAKRLHYSVVMVKRWERGWQPPPKKSYAIPHTVAVLVGQMVQAHQDDLAQDRAVLARLLMRRAS